jgi:acetoacetyl-CoA synthetase
MAATRPLWTPSRESIEASTIYRYMEWLRQDRGLDFSDYNSLYRWSVDRLEEFWPTIWDFFGVVAHEQYGSVLSSHHMPGAHWFAGATLNYAEHAVRAPDDRLAIIGRWENKPERRITYGQLRREVAATAAGLRRLGVGSGDRVAAFMPNTPHTVVCLLATASIGAIWSSCPPEFGIGSVIDRFAQIKPKLLIAADGYAHGGKAYDRMDAVREIQGGLASLEHTILVPNLAADPPTDSLRQATPWSELAVRGAELEFTPVPFEHPLWILYSSGTTGLPKPIVQGHGGIVLEHLKALGLHKNVGPEDRFFWHSTTGWMMWNFLLGGLLLGATIVTYDGSPAHPDMDALWRMAAETELTYFGTSAAYIQACLKAGIHPGMDFDLSRLRGVGSTGSPLSPEGFEWVYGEVGSDLILGSASGGTDVCTAFVGSVPLLPVYSGEIPCRMLGAKVEAYDQSGRPVVDQVGELVITEPLPSMPLYFWNDVGDARLKDSYFSTFPGVWRHGDWIRITPRGSCVIMGRSDSTLNRSGVRMGTSEFYRLVENFPEIVDSLVVDTGHDGQDGKLLLFIVLSGDGQLDDDLRQRLVRQIKDQLSPRHTPDMIVQVAAIPRTLTGKKMEIPVKRILSGAEPSVVASADAMADPHSLDPFVALARELSSD